MKRVFCTTLFSLFLLTALQPVRAQVTHAGAEPPSHLSLVLGGQLAGLIASPVAEHRYLGLELAHHFARTSDVDLRAVHAPVLERFRTDPEERVRLMALAVLEALGDEGSLQRMRGGIVDQASPRVQIRALAILHAAFGPGTFAGEPGLADIAASLRQQYGEEVLLSADARR